MSPGYLWSKIFKKIRGASIRDSRIHRSSKVEAGSQVVRSEFDRHSFCGYDCQIVDCHVGAFTSISDHVVIGGGMHPMTWVGMSPVFYEGRDSVRRKYATHRRPEPLRTTVGNDVWIGYGVLVKQGVTIGDGAVVGMGSVVTRDVPPYAIVAGNPAKLIRPRFDDATIELLLEIQWWKWDDETLTQHAALFKDLKAFLGKVGASGSA